MTASPFVLIVRAGMACLLALACAATAPGADRVSFDVPPGDAESALKAFSTQSGVEVVFGSRLVEGVRTPALRGDFTPMEALDRLLAGSPLTARRDERTGTITIGRRGDGDPNAHRAAAPADRPQRGDAEQFAEKRIVLDTFEVMGSKLLNMDLPRSRDDAQPYVIFDRGLIERSGATTIDDFLKQRVTMNTQGQSPSQFLGTFAGGTSSINLRGLGTEQTLILVDGHRIASFGNPNGFSQPDVNGIPMSAIERIEILPTTASGIYGGAATGGVVNIILRRDYAGAELRVGYENTFDTDAGIRTIDFSAGFSLEDGKTRVLLAASHRDANYLLFRDRPYMREGRARVAANNPAAITNASTPILGATTNIRSSNGSNLTLKTGGALNSPITFVPYGYSGIASDNGAALLANAGKYNLDIADTGQTGSIAGGGLLGTSNAPTVEGLTFTVRREFSPILHMFVEGAASNNSGRYSTGYVSVGTVNIPATSSANPFNQNITMMVPIYMPAQDVVVDVFSRRLTAGAIVQLPREWKSEADLAVSRTRYFGSSLAQLMTGFNTGVSNGSINVLRDLREYPVDYSPFLWPRTEYGPARTTQIDGTLRASGPLWRLAAGEVTLSGLVEYRDETLAEYTSSFQGVPVTRPERSQQISSGYLEARVPLIGETNARPWARGLELQLAVRRDDYTVNGTINSVAVGSPSVASTNRSRSTNPTVGIKYTPVRDIMVRASYGTGFLPPSVAQLVPGARMAPGTFAVVDPRRGNQTIVAGYTQGGNPDLRPEKSESYGGGIVFTPSALEGFRASLDYTHIRKRDNIISGLTASATALQAFVTNEASFPDRFVRGPNLATDPAGWPGPITYMDLTAANIATADVEALDAAVDYTWDVGRLGALDFFALATYQLRYDTQLVAGAPIVNNVGVNNLITSIPVKFRTNGGITWRRAKASLGWSYRYSDGFFTRDPTLSTSATFIANQGNGGRVAGEIYHDVFASYRFSRRGGESAWRVLSGLEVQVGIKNLFDRQAAFDAGNSTFMYSYLGETRGRSYAISVKRSF